MYVHVHTLDKKTVVYFFFGQFDESSLSLSSTDYPKPTYRAETILLPAQASVSSCSEQRNCTPLRACVQVASTYARRS